MDRFLADPNSEKIWHATLKGKTVETKTGNPAKPRAQSKSFKSTDEAKGYLEKQEWTKLKAGFVLQNPDANGGEATALRLLPGGWTGMLPLATSQDHLFCVRYPESQNELFVFDNSGAVVKSTKAKVDGLVLYAACDSISETIFFNADHSIYQLDSNFAVIKKPLAVGKEASASCLSVAGGRLLVYHRNKIEVRNLADDNELLSVEVTPDLYGGHTITLEAVLDRGGKLAAVHEKAGEIAIYDVKKGKLMFRFEGDIPMISKLLFCPQGKVLYAVSPYAESGLLAFDLKAKKQIPLPKDLPRLSQGKIDIACHPTDDRIAIVSTNSATIFDARTNRVVNSITLDHVVKRAGIVFFQNSLVALSDLGVLGFYAL
ncbi:WD40 repeat domain-containing protein [Rhodopirellula sp. MGV]|uniref:WD40 repeat domain-containing protein n=1 Tax=Rhodopirellula sp. MGV TaxID=2023130 RepID=UPI000B965786|nr:WD40 repeat domain-containing protein [Rhodopirellula sp. MGV]OYP36841.1 hypothetical protein CGZ80_07275 [Rhodopirellula sp. MGV]PNY36452.1 WD40 repeat domain-containing protein [Rhodopirellula baltica]